MSRKKLRKALKDPNTVHQVRLRHGRVVEWTGNDDDSPLREALATSPGRGGPAKQKKQRKKHRPWIAVVSGGAPGLGKRR
jgi:hypothetical protein